MKRKILIRTFAIIFCLAMMFSVTGCFGTLSKITKPIGKAETQDVKAIIALGKKFNRNWPAISGYLDGALGVKKGLLPHEALKAWADLDALAGVVRVDNEVKVNTPAADNDYEFAYAAGARARLLWPLVLEALKMIAPDVFQAVKPLL